MIDTREELVIALGEAAELEHGLMAQYLYAAFTLKRSGLPAAQASAVNNWRASLTMVARQEMAHLGTVHNLLAMVGGPPHFTLPRFPIASKFYSPAQTFTLEPLTLATIDRFVHFEAPEPPGPAGLVPDPLVYETVGDLYRQIRAALQLPGMFIGPEEGQDEPWSLSVQVAPTRNVAEANAAIDRLVEEGEATTGGGAGSHYQRFVAIRDQYHQLLAADPAFVPHRDVASNPATRAGIGSTLITDAGTRAVAELFNASYRTTLMALAQVYKFQERIGVPTPEANPIATLHDVCSGLMQGVIRKLGRDVLPELTLGDGRRAGPCFEVYDVPDVPWDRRVVWRVLAERAAIEATAAANLTGVHPGLAEVAQTLDLIRGQLEELIG